ncbi:MAG: hypothetical protein QOD27_452 [Microbacteriaceae bacterium]|nr:hypothetical protein [Microbacteriaceae bacterium]MDQ1548794.1 hypothetical protein [Microbacteriaceae bacterium]
MLLGIQDVEPEAAARIIGAPTTLIGTSAGSNVAAQISTGTPLQQLFERQLDEKTSEIFVEADFEAFMANMAAAQSEATSPDDARSRIGTIAKNTKTVAREVRRAVIEARLSGMVWSDRDLRITSVDADTGIPVVFDRESGVSLIDAVEASSAVPGIWPVVPLAGHRYIDGGVRTMANADLATGFDPVLVLIPQTERTPSGFAIDPSELEPLAPSRVHVIYADAVALAAFGTNPLDPGVRGPSALVGRELGRSIASHIAGFWMG